MKKILALLGLALLFLVFRNSLPMQIVLIMSLLLTAAHFARHILIPWYRERKTGEKRTSYRFHSLITLILLIAIFVALLVFRLFSLGPTTPDELKAHTDRINAVVYSSPFGLMLSGGSDRTVRLWVALTPEIKREFADQDGSYLSRYAYPFTSVAFHPRNVLVAFGSADKTVRLVNWRDKSFVRQLVGHTDAVKVLAFSPDGTLLASGSDDKTVRLWNVADGTLRAELKGHTDRITAIAFSADGSTVATAGADLSIKLWPLDQATPSLNLTNNTEPVIGLAFTPDGTNLLSVSEKRDMRRWKTADGALLDDLYKERSEKITSVAFTPDKMYFATGGHADKTIRLWKTTVTAPPPAAGGPTPTPGPVIPVRIFAGHTEIVTALAFDLSGKKLVSGSRDNTVRVWNFDTGTSDPPLAGHTDEITAVTISQDGSAIASAGADKSARVWQVKDGQMSYSWQDNPDEITHLAFAKGRESFVSVTRNGSIRVWRVADGTLMNQVTWGRYAVTSLAANPSDSSEFATGNANGVVRVWQPANGTSRDIAAHSGRVTSLAYSPDGKILATGGSDKSVELWKGTDNQRVNEWRGHTGGITSLAFSPDGKSLASASLDMTVHVWTFADTQLIAPVNSSVIKYLANAATTMLFSKDGSILVTAGPGSKIQVWKVADGSPLDEFESPVQSVLALGMDNGALVAAGPAGDGTTIKRWRVIENLSDVQNNWSQYSLHKALIGPEAAKLFWAGLFGLLFALGLVLAPLYAVSGAAARVTMSEYPGFNFDQARKAMFGVQLGNHQARLKIKNGELTTLREDSGMCAKTGPGELLVDEGNAAILKQSGKLTRVVGRGVTWLKQDEQVSMPVFLATRSEKVIVKNLLTRDQLRIESLEINVSHRVRPGEPNIDVGTSFPIDSVVLMREIWNPREQDWPKSVEGAARSALRDIVAQYDFEDLITVSGQARQDFNKKLTGAIAPRLAARGIEVGSVSIGEIEVPEETLNLLQERGFSEVRRETVIIDAEAQRDRIVREGEAQAESLERMERVKSMVREGIIRQLTAPIPGTGGVPFPDPEVAVSYIRAIESLTSAIIRDDVNASRYIAALEKVIASGGNKTFIFGDSKSLAPGEEIPAPATPES